MTVQLHQDSRWERPLEFAHEHSLPHYLTLQGLPPALFEVLFAVRIPYLLVIACMANLQDRTALPRNAKSKVLALDLDSQPESCKVAVNTVSKRGLCAISIKKSWE